MESLSFISQSQLWDTIGPFIIAAICTILAGGICFIAVKAVPTYAVSEGIRKSSPFIIVLVFAISIYMASGLWGWR
ncbi:hypothetical protein PAEVO_03720 [Paenibacillus sp. GM2FR]|uniref:hypothetical protein n=1 Tax=Paenibacillus sp. GM2FR TaxID=2059268 RepID=UPI000C27810E|nr:hypothetical protein [Paenibacillus sp. GM2FR]PJN53651.1 hypothetical protein PAEVO_03720 [Paenibacillus sp. GM2FR]